MAQQHFCGALSIVFGKFRPPHSRANSIPYFFSATDFSSLYVQSFLLVDEPAIQRNPRRVLSQKMNENDDEDVSEI